MENIKKGQTAMSNLKTAMSLAENDLEPTEIVNELIRLGIVSNHPTESTVAHRTAEHIESVGESNAELVKQLRTFGLIMAGDYDGAGIAASWVTCVAGDKHPAEIVEATKHILARAVGHYGDATNESSLCALIGRGLTRLMDHGAWRYCEDIAREEGFYESCERLISSLIEMFDVYGIGDVYVAEIVELNNPDDLIEVCTLSGDVVGEAYVTPSENSKPYDDAVRELIGEAPFKWVGSK